MCQWSDLLTMFWYLGISVLSRILVQASICEGPSRCLKSDLVLLIFPARALKKDLRTDFLTEVETLAKEQHE